MVENKALNMLINEMSFNRLEGIFNDKLIKYFEDAETIEPNLEARRFYSALYTAMRYKNLNIKPEYLQKILNNPKFMKRVESFFPEPNAQLKQRKKLLALDPLVNKIIQVLINGN